MKKLFLILIILLLFSCTKKEDAIYFKNESCKGMLDIEKWKREILHIDSIKINGKINIIDDKKKVLREFGAPTEILQPSSFSSFIPYLYMDSTEKHYEILYGKTVFEGIGGKVVLKEVDFQSTDIELIHPKIVLRKQTPALEICKLFPESCKLIIINGNAWSGHIELKCSDKDLDPRRWFLIFQREELTRVVLYTFTRE